jgi:small-conductance mechanosensitive channel
MGSPQKFISPAIPGIERNNFAIEVVMEIKLDGYITEEQFILARKLGQSKIRTEESSNGKKQRIKLRFSIEGWLVFLLAGGVLAVIAIVLLINLNIFSGALIAILAFFMIIIGFKAKISLEDIWKSIDGTKISGRITSDEIELATPTAQSRFTWNSFSGYGEEGEIVLLILKNSFQTQIISRNFFSHDQDWQEFKTTIAQYLPLTHSLQQNKLSGNEKLQLWLLAVFTIVIVSLIMFLALR